MAAPVYATDMTTIADGTEGTGNWSALGGGASGLNQETDYFIEGTNCITKNAWASDLKGMIYDNTTNISSGLGTDYAVVFWITHLTPNSLATKSSGGIRVLIGSGTGAYRNYYVGGSDTLEFGGWILGAVGWDTSVSPDAWVSSDGSDVGTPSTTVFDHFGGLANLPSGGPTKGAPFAIDAIRYGRCYLLCTGGDSGSPDGPATFSGANSYGDNVTRRWGLLSFRDGAYYQSGLFLFGDNGSPGEAVYFSDANKAIFIRDHDKVTQNFNTFEVRNTGTTVILTNISIQALGTVSPGRWITTDDATVTLTGCTFTDMGTFSFDSNTTVDSCTFRRCGQITANDADLSNSIIAESTVATNTSAVVWADPSTTNPNTYMDGMTFTMGANDSHAIEFGTATGAGSPGITFSLTDVTFNGYNTTTNNQNDSTLHIKYTSGNVTINIAGTGTASSNITYRSDGANVSIQSSINITFTGIPTGCNARLYLGSPNNSTSATLEASEDNITDGTFVVSTSNGGSVAYAVFMTLNEQYVLLDFPAGNPLPTTTSSIPVPFSKDRVYSNP